ncbi:MAG: tRNA pseudouridine(55) synthase TruB [Desulfovibrionaceae bacterium]
MGRKRQSPTQLDGVLVLNKPSGPTSAACLTRIKHDLGQAKIGHAGTLDPLACGVLLVLLGQATKIAPYLTGQTKTYRGTLRLGVVTDTFDIQGEVLEEHEVNVPPEAVEAAILAWRDLTEQEVPAYSAAKHHGKPLYALARSGQDVPVKTKAVTISRVEVLNVRPPLASFRVECSAGTYVRSLVHSLGMRCGCGAVLTELTRERSHPFGLDEAHTLDEVLGEPERFAERVIPLAQALSHWPRVALDDEQTGQVRNGVWLPYASAPDGQATGTPGRLALLAAPGGEPLALAELQPRDGELKWAIVRGLWR